ncbi:MAG: phage Gp37/Gp68 family protein [Chloroflexi bacterium]|nr:phage Gp37/Gp68 family protein [Chloroflexota bacterium]
MNEKTLIEWTDATWNPVTGCTKVSPGCDNCYAERLTERFGRGPFSNIRLHSDRLKEPFQWRKPSLIFTCSMADLFHPSVPWDFLLSVFSVMEQTPRHTYQVLTKRPGRMAYFANQVLRERWPSNVWAGTSVENQKYAARLDVLMRVPAEIRFVSAEPLLERLDLRPWLCSGILQWVIVGGESGSKARALDIEWVRTIKHHCQQFNIPLFVKQLGTAWARERGAADSKGGNPREWPHGLHVRDYPERESVAEILDHKDLQPALR